MSKIEKTGYVPKGPTMPRQSIFLLHSVSSLHINPRLFEFWWRTDELKAIFVKKNCMDLYSKKTMIIISYLNVYLSTYIIIIIYLWLSPEKYLKCPEGIYVPQSAKCDKWIDCQLTHWDETHCECQYYVIMCQYKVSI